MSDAGRPVVGLEIHVQLKTRTKMFCRCANGFGGGQNTQTCPVCLGLPGALPVPNRRAIEWTIKLGLALGCEIADRGRSSRARTTSTPTCQGLPDLPVRPAALRRRQRARADAGRRPRDRDRPRAPRGGRGEDRPRRRAQRPDPRRRLLARRLQPRRHAARRDRHRARTSARPRRRKRFLQLLRQTIVELGISDAEMEKGTLRVDANVSVRPAGTDELRTRTELKNMNSFNFVAQGIERRGRAPDRGLRGGRRGRPGDLDFDAGQRDADAAPLEGGGRRLPLLPRARPRAGRAAGGARRAAARRAAREPRRARIRRLETSCRSRRAIVLVTGGLDGLSSASAARAPTRRRPRT